jgi:hypothetical protein
LRASTADVDLYRLLDELGVALNEIFAESREPEKTPAPPTRRSAVIIPLAAYRRQRRLKSSA